MLYAVVAALACLCLVATSPASEPLALRTHLHSLHVTKELSSVLIAIEERLKTIDKISSVQAQYARKLDVIQDKLDRVETTLSLRLERAQLAAERLEHRLHMLQTSVQASIEESSKHLKESQAKVTLVATNLTNHLTSHRHLLEKVSGAYVETWRRGLTLETLMKDGLSLINATRRELADGLRTMARRQRDARMNSADLENAFTRKLNDNTNRIDLKMQEMLDAQKHFLDSCQRVQLDDPTHVADVLDKLIDSLINKTASTFRELQNIQTAIRNHDTRVNKILNTSRIQQSDSACRRLESAFRNSTRANAKESELQQLTEKFVALTNRADAALQKLEARLFDDDPAPNSDVSHAAVDQLLRKLKGINDQDLDEDSDEEQESGYFDDDMGGDIMEEDRIIMTKRGESGKNSKLIKELTTRQPHRRHLHKHPYDRGPSHKNSLLP